MRWRSTAKGVEHPTKLHLCFVAPVASDFERLQHDVRIMVADGARGQLHPIADDVVLKGLDAQNRVLVGLVESKEARPVELRHRERIMRKVDPLLFLIPLVHREVDDPTEFETALLGQAQLAAKPRAGRAGNCSGACALVGCAEEY